MLEEETRMATGWAGDGAVQQQIDDSIADAIKRARAQLPAGPSPSWRKWSVSLVTCT